MRGSKRLAFEVHPLVGMFLSSTRFMFLTLSGIILFLLTKFGTMTGNYGTWHIRTIEVISRQLQLSAESHKPRADADLS